MSDISLLHTLPIELVSLVLDRCHRPDDVLHFGKTCTFARSAVRQYLQFHLKRHLLPGTKWLFGEQVKGLLCLEKDRTSNIYLQAPMGQGKTLLSIMHAVRSWKELGVRTLIVIPTDTFTSWRDEFKKRGFKVIGTRPHESDILICHSKCKNHKRFIESTPAEDFEHFSHYIILTTTSYISGGGHSIQTLRDLSNVYEQVIVDEGQRIGRKHYQIFLRHFKRVIYLSASPIEQSFTYRGEECQLYDRHINLVCEFDHHVEMRWKLVPTIFDRFNVVRKIFSLLRDVTIPKRKVVLFTHWNSKDLALHVKLFKNAMPEWGWFRFYNTSLASLEKWRNAEHPSVLVTTILSATEGTNFEAADATIYVDFGCMVIERARQCFGRVRRRTNPNSVVYNYLLYDQYDPVDYLRTRLNAYYASRLDLNVSRKQNAQLRAIYNFMLRLGINIHSLPEADFVTIFGLSCDDQLLPYVESDYFLPIFDILKYSNFGWC